MLLRVANRIGSPAMGVSPVSPNSRMRIGLAPTQAATGWTITSAAAELTDFLRCRGRPTRIFDGVSNAGATALRQHLHAKRIPALESNHAQHELLLHALHLPCRPPPEPRRAHSKAGCKCSVAAAPLANSQRVGGFDPEQLADVGIDPCTIWRPKPAIEARPGLMIELTSMR